MTESERDVLLARIDERTKKIEDIERAVSALRADMDSRFDDFHKNHVTREEFDDLKNGSVSLDKFEPVRNLVYGFVAVTMLAVVGGLISLVVVN